MVPQRIAFTLIVVLTWRIALCINKHDTLISEIHSHASEKRPLENPLLFEGDIFPVDGNLSYNAISEYSRLWPQNVIYYEIDYSLQGYSGLIERAIEEYHRKTCIRFQQGRGRGNFVRIFYGQGCYANVGMVGGEQPLSLGRGCHFHGTAVHELGHVAGFYHEHTRSDRDQYIDLYLHNVNPLYYPQFQKLAPSENLFFNRFDYESVMLYGSRSFSNNGQYSMTRKDGGVLVEVHEKHGLSAADVERVNKLYNCNEISDEDGDIHVVDESPIPHWSHQNPNLWGGQWGSWDNPQLIDLHKT